MTADFTPWPEEYVKKYRSRGYWREMTLTEVLEDTIFDYPERIALISGDVRVTYKELGHKFHRMALHFLDQGIKPGDRVIVQLPNMIEFIYVFYGLIEIGAVPVLALPGHRQAEISYFIKHTEAKAYVIVDQLKDFKYIELAQEMLDTQMTLEKVFVIGEAVRPGMISLSELLDIPIENRYPSDCLEKLRPDTYDMALMILSGGTTSIPKLIPRTHNDYVYNSLQSGRVTHINQETVYLAVLPLCHNFTLGSPGCQATLFAGGRVVFCPSWDTETVFTLVERERVTVTSIVVPMMTRWTENRELISKFDLSSLKVIQYGGSKITGDLVQRILDAFPNTIPQEVFGMAEGLLILNRLDDPRELLIESAGKPMCRDDEVKVVDDDGNDLPVGEIGELVVRGPYTIRGYFKAEEYNRTAFLPGGFYRTGDLVRIDENGYIYSEGRKKELVIRGGEKINTEEIEELIRSHPAVFNAAVVPMPDPVFGEKSCAYVILKDENDKLDLTELNNFLLEKHKIAKIKLPERLEIVAEFPLSPVGKVFKRVLKDDIAKKLKEEGVIK